MKIKNLMVGAICAMFAVSPLMAMTCDEIMSRPNHEEEYTECVSLFEDLTINNNDLFKAATLYAEMNNLEHSTMYFPKGYAYFDLAKVSFSYTDSGSGRDLSAYGTALCRAIGGGDAEMEGNDMICSGVSEDACSSAATTAWYSSPAPYKYDGDKCIVDISFEPTVAEAEVEVVAPEDEYKSEE